MTLRITLVPTKSAFCFGGGCVVTGVEFSLNFGGCVVLWVGKRVKESITQGKVEWVAV